MSKNQKQSSTAVVSAENAVAPTLDAAEIAAAIKRQVVLVGEIELRGNFEKIRLGAMVSEAVRRLKLDGEPVRGRSAKGGGALGWWAEVCPKDGAGESVISYKTVMKWKDAAENLPHILNRLKCEDPKVPDTWRPKPTQEVIEILASRPEEVLTRSEQKVLTSAEKAANGLTMRQMLLWGGEDEAAKPKAGRPKAPEGPVAKLSRRDEAKAIWNRFMLEATKRSLKDALPLLGEAETRTCYESLYSLVVSVKHHLDEFKGGQK